MDTEISASEFNILSEDIAIVFRYSRANIYSYHALIGALEIHPLLNDIPVFFPKPENFIPEVNRLLTINQYNRLIIGLSLHTFQLEENLKVIEELNNHPFREQIFIVAGGPHPSAHPEELLDAGADVVVNGEGEKTFADLIIAILNNKPLHTVKGISFKEVTKIYNQNPNDLIDLNSYPPFAPKHQLYSALEITRGCKFNCKYCQTPKLFGHKVRYRKPAEIIKWGQFLLTKRDNWDFRFISPNAFGYYSKLSSQPNINMIKELLLGLSKLEAKNRKRIFFGTFPSEIRPESVTEDTLSLTKKYCDNESLTIGAQTGSPRIMSIIKRGHTVETVRNSINLAIEYGFKVNVDFIIGYPEETKEDQYLTIELCKELLLKGCKIHMHYLIPLPGTEYENSTPSAIDTEILTILRQWSNENKIFGSWQHQYDVVARNIKRTI